jgi:hypothetical protein
MPLFSKGYIIERQISKGIFRLRTHHNMGLSVRETIHYCFFFGALFRMADGGRDVFRTVMG